MPNKNLKAERIRHGYSQMEIAKLSGMSETTYNLKENGKRDFTQTEMLLLSKILEKTMDELFKR